MVAMIPVLNAMSVWVLVRHASIGTPDWRAVMITVARNPFIWACFIGLALNPVTGWIPQPAHTFVDALGHSSLALGLLIIGAGLRIEELIRPNAVMAVTCFLKLLVMPAIAVAIGYACGL